MTAYTAIADSEIDPESPYTTTLATKMRDNPIAITEGASGAPPIARIARSDPGRLVYISKATLSATASAIFTNLGSTYDSYYFIIKSLYASAGSNTLVMQTSTNNGSSYDTTNYRYHSQNMVTTAATYAALNASSTSSIFLTGIALGISNQDSVNSEYIITNISSSSDYTKICGRYTRAGGTFGNIFGSRAVAETVNAVKFFGSAAGNLTGEIIMYGIDSGA